MAPELMQRCMTADEIMIEFGNPEVEFCTLPPVDMNAFPRSKPGRNRHERRRAVHLAKEYGHGA